MAGRPKGEELPKVPIQVMVRPVVRDYLIRAANAENKSMSTYVNEILERWHQGR